MIIGSMIFRVFLEIIFIGRCKKKFIGYWLWGERRESKLNTSCIKFYKSKNKSFFLTEVKINLKNNKREIFLLIIENNKKLLFYITNGTVKFATFSN
jgi:hypothetical protein